jgi:hypothetical protein
MMKEWQKNMKVYFKINNITLDIVTFADDQAIISDTEMEFSGQFLWEQITKTHKVKHSTKKSKTLAFKRK